MNQLFNNDITLHRDSHTYQLLDDSNVNFKSVTTFIGDYFEEFDAKKIATKLVKSNIKYMHLTVEELMAQWAKSSEYGTLVHEELEHFILHKTPVNELKSRQGVQWLKNYFSCKYIQWFTSCDFYNVARQSRSNIRIVEFFSWFRICEIIL